MSLMKTESPRIPDNAIFDSDPAESLCVSLGYFLSLDPPTVCDRQDDPNNRVYYTGVCVNIRTRERDRERERG